MRIKTGMLFSFIMLFILGAGAEALKKRPCQMQFVVNAQVVSYTAIVYDAKGDVIKMMHYEQGTLSKYDKYIYDSKGILTAEEAYDAENSLIQTRKYIYDASGILKEEQVLSAGGQLIEYGIYSYNNNKISRVETLNPDRSMNRFVEYRYTGSRLDSMFFNSPGEYTMTTKCVYNDDALLAGYTIDHSDFKGKGTAEVKLLYEDKPASEQAWKLILR